MEENLLNIPYWNQKNLTPPEMISKPLICKKPTLVSMKLSKLLKDIQSELEEVLNSLNTDAALFSRLIYRMKKVFRHDKTLQGMQKINKCLSNLLSINLLSTINELNICSYDDYGPTKEMVQWTMLSFQRLAALLNALINRCSATVPSLKNKIDSGHHWNIAVVTLGVIARIWLLSRHLCLKSCQWYKELNVYVGKTMVTNENVMLSTHNFPQDLIVWLDNPSYLQEKSNEVLVFSAVVSDQAEDEVDEAISEPVKKESDEDITSLYFKEDLGKIITRDELKEYMYKKAKAEFKDDVIKHGKHAGDYLINKKMNHLTNLKRHPDKWKKAKKCPYTLGNELKNLKRNS